MDQRTETSTVRFGIVGARERSRRHDEIHVDEYVRFLKRRHGEHLVVISGGCRTGADKFAKDAARRYSVTYVEHPVEGSPRNKHEFTIAAYERNTKVAVDALNGLFALVKPARTGGTEDTVTKYKTLIDMDWKVGLNTRTLYLVHSDFTIETYHHGP